MIKMLLCLLCGVAIGIVSLELRHQQLELRHRAVTLREQIEKQQARLWSQQLQISVYTSPRAVAKTLNGELPLTPEGKLPPEAGNWVREDAD